MQKEVVDDSCPGGWWTNLLYINNLYSGPDPQTGPVLNTFGCLGYTWYLANDTQFYILSPILLVTLLLCASSLLSELRSVTCSVLYCTLRSYQLQYSTLTVSTVEYSVHYNMFFQIQYTLSKFHYCTVHLSTVCSCTVSTLRSAYSTVHFYRTSCIEPLIFCMDLL